ncbi:MAG: accessory gene regulator B family protein [Lachnospiraceae bacterium]|nr:accessory gene regulator B family protein [Lachnospiraceae bacterium]
MIEVLIQKLVNAFVANELISEDEREKYLYTLLCLVESWLTIGSILLIGFFIGKLLPTICFCFCFFSLRYRTGGFHLPTFAYCYIGSLVLYGVVCFCCAILKQYNLILFGATLLSSLCIIVLGTVNHPNMNMTKDELNAARSSSKWMLSLELLIIAFMLWMQVGYDFIAYSCSGIILCALLLIIAKLKGQEVKV